MSTLHCKPRRLVWLTLFLILGSPGLAEEERLMEVASGSSGWLARGFAGPVRALRKLPDRGVQLQFQYVHDLSKAPAGACGSGGWFGRASWDIAATADGEKLGVWRGGTAFLHIKQHLEEFGEVDSGVFQGYSNIDAESQLTLYEAWAQQEFFSGKVRIKAGKIDANADFDAVSTAADFLNSSMGYSPTIMEFPSYPAARLGAEVLAALPRSWRVSVGRFATEEGDIALAEGSHSWKLTKNAQEGRAAVGMWRLRERLERFDGSEASHSQGFYGVLEQSLWRGAPAGGSDVDEPGRKLSAYVQVGIGNGRENPNTGHVGAGVVWTAPWRRRPADAAGWAVSSVRFSGSPGAGFDLRGESVFEMYYKFALTRTTAMVMDAQYFRHPDGMRANPDALFVTPRLVISF